jgi:capsular polysaccharide transport system permease protein
LRVNSQNKDPSIAAVEAAAEIRNQDAEAETTKAEGKIREDAAYGATAPAEEEALPRRAAGPGGRGQQRLRAVQGAAGMGPGVQGMGPGAGRQGPTGLGPRPFDAEGFAPETQPELPGPLGPRPAPARQPKPQQISNEPVRAAVSPAQIRPRHRGVMALAFLLIVVPAMASAVYLWGFAVDQYVSTAGFAIRNQNAMSSPFDFLGAFGGSSSSTAKDTDILHSFVGSQQLVQKLDKEIGIQAIYSKPKNDPLFSYDTSGTIEDLVKYWGRMVQVSYDNTTGLMQLNVYAFTPEDAQTVAQAVLAEGSLLVNQLAAVARDDTIKYATQALRDAEDRLKTARAALTTFRVENNIVDPTMDLSAMSKIYGALTQQLVQSQVELEVLKQGTATSAGDPRIAALQQRIDIIQNRIAEEQNKIGATPGTASQGYADIIARYQELSADLEFGEKAYLTSLAAYDTAVEDAQHKQVYLATYEKPTLAQASVTPQRWLILIAVVVIGFLLWSILTLVYYALRDRR